MTHTPKQAAPRRSLRRGIGVLAVSAATAAAGIGLSASTAQANSVWDRLAQCEAGGNWSINTGNGFYGGLQFTLSSWRAAGGTAYAAYPHQASREGQIAAGKRLLAMQGPGAWPVCSVRAGLTRASGMSDGSAAPAAARAAAPRPAAKQAAPRVSAQKAPAKVTTSAPKAAVTPKAAAAKPKAPAAPPKPAGGKLSAEGTKVVQSWIGGDLSGRWDPKALSALQRKVGAKETGRTDVQSVALVEKLIGAPASGLPYYTQGALDKLAAYATAQLTSASLTSLTAAVEGGVPSPATVSLATTPASYR